LNAKTTRRRFLRGAAAGAAWVALGSIPGCESDKPPRVTATRGRAGQAWAFRSRSDLSPPVIEVTARGHDNTAPDYILVAPKNGPEEAGPGQDGCMIVDEDGQPVWFRPLRREEWDVMDFKVQNYRGEPVLTWWEGFHTGYGQGEYVIADGSYREISRVRAANGYVGDHHEFLISPQDTALLTIYSPVRVDLSSLGGPKDGVVLEGIAQEVAIETGEVLFEWHSLEHVGLEESYYEPSRDQKSPFDYFHINSIDVDHDNNLLISARRTSTVYKIDRESGEVIWRLGGKKSDFEMGSGIRRAYQHDARRQPNGTITIFDNGAWKVDDQSYGLVLELDEDEMSATRVRRYAHPDKVLSETQGNVQVLPNSNVFIGWGSEPVLSEFASDGELLFNASFPPEAESYRAFRFPWSGQPDDDPAVVAEPGADDKVTLYVSWNGATEVATWQVLAGSNPEELQVVASVPRKGFETVITVETTEAYVGVRAKNDSGRVLGTSRVFEPRG
jgi:Arylsulfotransferase (ASST)